MTLKPCLMACSIYIYSPEKLRHYALWPGRFSRIGMGQMPPAHLPPVLRLIHLYMYGHYSMPCYSNGTLKNSAYASYHNTATASRPITAAVRYTKGASPQSSATLKHSRIRYILQSHRGNSRPVYDMNCELSSSSRFYIHLQELEQQTLQLKQS